MTQYDFRDGLPTGWLSAREQHELERLAAGRRVLEIGVWKARSTVALARVARQVVAIDHFRGDAFAGHQDTLREAVDNVRWYGVADRVAIVVADFRDAFPAVVGDDFDLIFYDGCHSYELTRAALERMRGTRADLACHDYAGNYPGVIRAWDELIGPTARVFDTLVVREGGQER